MRFKRHQCLRNFGEQKKAGNVLIKNGERGGGEEGGGDGGEVPESPSRLK